MCAWRWSNPLRTGFSYELGQLAEHHHVLLRDSRPVRGSRTLSLNRSASACQEIIQTGAKAEDMPDPFLGRAVMYHGWYCMRLARYDQAIKLTRQGLAMSQQPADLEGYGLALNSLGVIATYQGKYRQAKSYLQEALKVLSGERLHLGASRCAQQPGRAGLARRRYFTRGGSFPAKP